MNTPLLKDHKVTGLLNRVREDVNLLRSDIGSLLAHTTQQTIPRGARGLADQARNQLAAGGAYAASRLRDFRAPPPRQSAGWIGGVVLVGLLAYGAYALCRRECAANRMAEEDAFDPDGEIIG